MTAVSSANNQDTSYEIALISDAMSAMNTVNLLWTVHIEYLLQELYQLTTNLTEITMPD